MFPEVCVSRVPCFQCHIYKGSCFYKVLLSKLIIFGRFCIPKVLCFHGHVSSGFFVLELVFLRAVFKVLCFQGFVLNRVLCFKVVCCGSFVFKSLCFHSHMLPRSCFFMVLRFQGCIFGRVLCFQGSFVSLLSFIYIFTVLVVYVSRIFPGSDYHYQIIFITFLNYFKKF